MSAFWNLGTCTLTEGSPIVTGQGTEWNTALLRSGDTIVSDDGRSATIDTVDSPTQITLDKNWVGAGQIAAPYKAWYTPDDIFIEGKVRQALALIGQQNLAALSALDGAGGNKLIRMTGAGTMDLVDALNVFALAGLDGAGGDKLPYLNGPGTMAATALTAKARELLGGADATAMRTILGAQAALGYTPVNKAGDTVTGAMTFNDAATLGGGTVGRMILTPGSASFPGFLAFHSPDGMRRGYAGWANDDYLTLTGDNGWGWRVPSNTQFRVSGPFFSDGPLEIRVGTAFTQQGMDKLGWATGFPLWQRVIEATNMLSFYSYDPNNGALLAQAFSLTQAGNLSVPGTISGSAKNFVIDDPLDPLDRDLVHVSIEAPEHWVRYGGKVRLVDGIATVDIDATHRMVAGTFAAFTRNAVVTCLQNLEGFARLKPGPITGGGFEIICEDDTCTDEVAWEVRAERCDPFVMQDASTDNDGYLVVQPMKPDFEEQSQ